MLVSRYTYAVVYVLSVAAFIAVIHPSIVEDYVRACALGFAIIVALWTVQSALIYQARYTSLPPERRGRMMDPKLAWAMGVAFIGSLALNARQVLELVGRPLEWYGAPALLLVMAAATYWLLPLIRHERNMRKKERGIT